MVGALFKSALLTASLIEGSVNSDVFAAWIKQDLLPNRSYAVEICAKRSGVAESIYTYRDSATTVANATSAQNDSKNSILL
ncbi:hypothetical protein CCP3SC5AM1_1490002 [Gammaproteobacteria bacterium]